MKPTRQQAQQQSDLDRQLDVLSDLGPVPAGLEARIMARARIAQIGQAEQSRGWLPQRLLWPVGAAAVMTALVLGILVGSSTWRPGHSASQATQWEASKDSILWEAPFSGYPEEERWLTDLALVEPEDK